MTSVSMVMRCDPIENGKAAMTTFDKWWFKLVFSPFANVIFYPSVSFTLSLSLSLASVGFDYLSIYFACSLLEIDLLNYSFPNDCCVKWVSFGDVPNSTQLRTSFWPTNFAGSRHHKLKFCIFHNHRWAHNFIVVFVVLWLSECIWCAFVSRYIPKYT